ncbi:MAG: hypothetical protein DRO39_09880 [Thermoprotei archaeon]|nr:MAG: hypothetical protein DRO39_09880 [Thermoprotei archaeon]
MGYAPLDRLVSDFASGRQGVTALVLVAVADLARRGVEEFGVGEVHEAVTRILSKLRSRPGFLEQEPAPMAMAAPLGRLSDMGGCQTGIG